MRRLSWAAKVPADGGVSDGKVLGLFGNDDRAPSPEQVDQHEAALQKAGKTYEFHGFFYWRRPLYRPERAMDG